MMRVAFCLTPPGRIHRHLVDQVSEVMLDEGITIREVLYHRDDED